jgi:hypothetical protein
MSIDSASACRFLRSRCRPRCRPTSCHTLRQTTCRIVPAPCAPAACAPVVACDPCGDEHVVISEVTTQCCVPADGSAHAVIEAFPSQPTDTVVATPQLAAEPSAVAEQPALAMPKPTPITAPHPPLEPVAPASAEKAVAEPQFKTAKEVLAEAAAKETEQPPAPQFKTAAEILAEEQADAPPMKEPAATEPATPLEPAQPLTEPITEAPADKEPPMEEDAPPAKPQDEEPAPAKHAVKNDDNLFDEESDEPEDAPEAPAEDGPSEPEADATESPTDEPVTEKPADEPKAEDDPFAAVLHAPDEPVRRWIDDSGRHETIGRLVEVHPDRVRILKSNGRYATVPLERLSRHDQSYVSATGERIAAQQAPAPAATDTAAL